MAEVVRGLRPGLHYETDDEGRNATLTDAGSRAAERALGGIDLYAADQIDALTRLNVALHAHALLRRDVDYIVRDGEVRLISASRGRVAELQRWPDGLQAAVEAKEGIAASESGEILDSITVESLVRRYPRVCGMTGTAVTVGDQLRQFYGLEVAVIPPNRPCVREDEPDRLYATTGQKEKAIVAEVAGAHATGRPVLIGTLDIAESERLARRLAAAGLPHVVLNAKNDADEAAIVAEAGAQGAITVSTQMAGRGTDIRLGGSGGGEGGAAGAHGRPRPGRRARRPVRDRHRPAREQPARQPAARPVRPPGRPGRLGVLRLHGGRADHQLRPGHPGAPRRRGRRPGPRRRGGRGGGARAAGRGRRQPGDPPEHVPLSQADRGPAGDRAGAPGPADARRRRPGGARPSAARSGTRSWPRPCRPACWPPRRARSSCTTSTAAGPITSPCWPRSARASTCARSGPARPGGGRDPLGDFHAEAVKLFTSLMDRVQEQSAETFRTASITEAGVDLDAAGLRRPTATWTYVRADNPFGTALDRAMRRLAGRKDRQ